MRPRELVKGAVNSWMAGDHGAFWRLLHPDVVYSVIGTTAVSGTFEGRRAFIDEALMPMGRLLAVGARPVSFETIAEGDRVVLMWSGRGVMANGAPYDNDYCWVITVADDRIVGIRAYLDTALVDALFDQDPA